MIIGISGWKRSGKDTAAGILIQKGFNRLSFADKLKEMTSEIYNIDIKHFYDQDLKEKPLMHLPVAPKDDSSLALSSIFKNEMYNDNGQLYWTPRSLLIYEGSVKRAVDPDYWVNISLASANPDGLHVISDLRYKSEAEAIKNCGMDYLLIRINRFEENPSTDPSETDLDDYQFDVYIDNTRSLDDFQNDVLSAARMFSSL